MRCSLKRVWCWVTELLKEVERWRPVARGVGRDVVPIVLHLYRLYRFIKTLSGG